VLTRCHEKGCTDDAMPGTDPPRCPAHAIHLPRAHVRRAACPAGCNSECDGEPCRFATVTTDSRGWKHITPAPYGRCAMAQGGGSWSRP
jgi:hypothetical protein